MKHYASVNRPYFLNYAYSGSLVRIREDFLCADFCQHENEDQKEMRTTDVSYRKIITPAKLSFLRSIVCVLLLFTGGFWSYLSAQKFDPALLGASYVLPLQLGDWPLKIGPESQLFVDDFLIDSISKIVRIDHQPRKYEGNPILQGTHANGTIIYIPETKQYRMYYEGCHRVAFSNDGLNWTKPNLGIVNYNGSTDNNLIIDYSFRTDLASFIYDPLDPDPGKRWKASVYYYDKKENPRKIREGLYALFSPDGLHWKTDVLIVPGMTDSPTNWPMTGIDDVSTVVWDKKLGKYIALLKIWDLTDGRFYRARAMAFSDDFIHWSQPWSVFLADKLDPPDLQFYGMTAWSYESMWLGTLRTLHSETSTEQVDFQLVTSRDGIHWARAAKRGPFIPNGPEGSIDHGYHTDFSNPPLRFGDELYFYYGSTAYGKSGAPTDLKTGICLAKLRVDGFSSLHAKSRTEPAFVITRPLEFTGRELYVNANAGKGTIQVEILGGDKDNDYKPIPGFTEQESVTLQADGIRQLVTWKGQKDLASLVGKRVRLKFKLSGLAALYSFTVR
jgi:hypothetical protein